MINCEVEIVSAEFNFAAKFQLHWQQNQHTERCESVTQAPKFERRILKFTEKEAVLLGKEREGVIVPLRVNAAEGDATEGIEVIVSPVQLQLGKQSITRQLEIPLTGARGAETVNGTVHIMYKCYRSMMVEALRKDRVLCLSIGAAHLNTLVATVFELEITVLPPDGSSIPAFTVTKLVVSNDSPNVFADLAAALADDETNEAKIKLLEAETVQLLISDKQQPERLFKVLVLRNQPKVVSISMVAGDPLVLTVHLHAGYRENGSTVSKRFITSSFHSCAIRDGVLTGQSGNKERRMSLSPRRVSSWDETASALGLLGSEHAIPTTKKSLLYLEDSNVQVVPTANKTIISGIEPALAVNHAGEVFPYQKISMEKYHKDLIPAANAAAERGPTNGVYIFCKSKSEMLDTPVADGGGVMQEGSAKKKKKNTKKQLVTINLGTVTVRPDALTHPLKLRTSMVDLNFEKCEEEEPASFFSAVEAFEQQAHAKHLHTADAVDNPELTSAVPPVDRTQPGAKIVRHQQKSVLAYIGSLEETSRELFNETGLIACTLEGKLFRPNLASGAASVDDDSCIAVKLFLSLIPCGQEEEKGQPTVEESKKSNEEISSQAVDNSLTSPHADDQKIDDASAQDAAAIESIDHSINYGVVEKEVLDWRVLKEHKLDPDDADSLRELASQYQNFNEVTPQTAHQEELIGSSSLNLPNAKLSKTELERLHHDQKDNISALSSAGGSTQKLSAAPSIEAMSTAVDDTGSVHTHLSGAERIKSTSSSVLKANLSIAELHHDHRDDISQLTSPSLSAAPSHIAALRGNESNQKLSVAPSASAASTASGGTSIQPQQLISGAFGDHLDADSIARISRNNHMGGANAGSAFAAVIRAELDEKQKLIEKLMDEVHARSEAIQLVGKDIRQLREEKIDMEKQMAALTAERDRLLVEDAKATALTAEAMNAPAELHNMDKASLVRNLNKMRNRLSEATKEKGALQTALVQAKDVIKEYATLKTTHKQLEEAHLQQSQYLRKMERQIKEVNDYKSTIKIQEKVISKMQGILETKLKSGGGNIESIFGDDASLPPPKKGNKSSKSGKPPLPSLDMGKQQDEVVRVPESELLAAREEIQFLTEKVGDLERQLFDAKLSQYDDDLNSKGSSDDDVDDITDDGAKKSKQVDLKSANHRIDELEAEVVSKNYRISALEQQLDVSTRDYSKEIARLRTKLFELEISASMADDDIDDANYGNIASNEEVIDRLLNARSRPPTQQQTDANELGTTDASSKSKRIEKIPSGSARSAAHALKQNDVDDIENVAKKTFISEGNRIPSIDSNFDLDRVPTPDNESDDVDSASRQRVGDEHPNVKEISSDLRVDENYSERKKEVEAESAEDEEDAEAKRKREEEEAEAKRKREEEEAEAKRKREEEEAEAKRKREEEEAEAKRKREEEEAEAKRKREEEEAEAKRKREEEEAEAKRKREEEEAEAKRKREAEEAEAKRKREEEEEARKHIAIDKDLELTVNMKHADLQSLKIATKDGSKLQLANSSESSVPVSGDRPMHPNFCGKVSLSLHYHYEPDRGESSFEIKRLHLSNFTSKDVESRFHPYLHLRFTSANWSCKTRPLEAQGFVAEWKFDEQGYSEFDKTFKCSDQELEEDAELLFFMKKSNAKGNEDFLIGMGVLDLYDVKNMKTISHGLAMPADTKS